MKKFVVMGALAVALAVCSHQEASAWVNAKFGVGLNWAYQSGGNNLLWGVYRNGQPPACCDGPGCGPGFYGPGYGPGFYGPGYGAAGGYPGYPYAGTNMGPVAPFTPPAPTLSPTPSSTQPSSSLEYNGFQTVNYPMYYAPNYCYPVNYGR